MCQFSKKLDEVSTISQSISTIFNVIGVTIYVQQDVCYDQNCQGEVDKLEFWKIGQSSEEANVYSRWVIGHFTTVTIFVESPGFWRKCPTSPTCWKLSWINRRMRAPT